jgi:hypothetical protein
MGVYEFHSFKPIHGKCEKCRISSDEDDVVLIFDENGCLLCEDCIFDNFVEDKYGKDEEE